MLVRSEEIVLDDFSAASRLEFQLAEDEIVRLLVDPMVQSQLDHPGGGYVLLLREGRELVQDSTE